MKTFSQGFCSIKWFLNLFGETFTYKFFLETINSIKFRDVQTFLYKFFVYTSERCVSKMFLETLLSIKSAGMFAKVFYLGERAMR